MKLYIFFFTKPFYWSVFRIELWYFILMFLTKYRKSVEKYSLPLTLTEFITVHHWCDGHSINTKFLWGGR